MMGGVGAAQGCLAEAEEPEGKLMPRIRWTPEEDERLLDMITSGKSWTLISATLKRSVSHVRLHAKSLAARKKPKSDTKVAVILKK